MSTSSCKHRLVPRCSSGNFNWATIWPSCCTFPIEPRFAADGSISGRCRKAATASDVTADAPSRGQLLSKGLHVCAGGGAVWGGAAEHVCALLGAALFGSCCPASGQLPPTPSTEARHIVLDRPASGPQVPCVKLLPNAAVRSVQRRSVQNPRQSGRQIRRFDGCLKTVAVRLGALQERPAGAAHPESVHSSRSRGRCDSVLAADHMSAHHETAGKAHRQQL